MTFPVESIPDATVWAPHHGVYGLLAALFVLAVVWDDLPHREPVTEAAGVLIGLFGFLFVWPWYPTLGAGMALGGPVVAAVYSATPASRWRLYPTRLWAVYLGGLAVGLDDIVDHALPVPTPLDTAWAALGPTVSAALAVGAVIGAAWAVRTGATTKP